MFGSVARGEADRKSEIDLFVLVEGDRTVVRRIVTEVVAELGDEQFDGDRYEFESYVESVEDGRCTIVSSSSRSSKSLFPV
ncbi:nucleotidyltransferase domain-containing protein [Haladaptatus caseinilyticus]|uniref:nucleotidyltransferase domain-containing protein n=1 Tax=Haladaptatus caseinilyticus TaxID=2993314 RepID=UPI00224B84DE|nr:nucleotidyltransferase domain-containing protein [Haladaptatus caseinilyticus]